MMKRKLEKRSKPVIAVSEWESLVVVSDTKVGRQIGCGTVGSGRTTD